MSKVLLINGSPHAHGCTFTALSVVAGVLGRNMAFLIRAIAREREAAGLPETEPQRIATNFIQ